MDYSNKEQFGQFFTTSENVHRIMSKFISHKNKKIKCLEPSAGAGHLVKLLESLKYSNITAIELDSTIKPVTKTLINYFNFFDFQKSNSGYDLKSNSGYDLIIGNPPYVKFKNMPVSNKIFSNIEFIKQKYSDKGNLYYLFIDKCIDLLNDKGELIFIVPKEWLYTSSASILRKKISKSGSITDICDCGDEKLFKDANLPSCIIFRFEKNLFTDEIKYYKNTSAGLTGNYKPFLLKEFGKYLFLGSKNLYNIVSTWPLLGEYFSPKVGIVSGADSLFEINDDNLLISIEQDAIREYITTAGVKKYIDVNDYSFNQIPQNARKCLTKLKSQLVNRKIHKFDETNWWKYGAIRNKDLMLSNKTRFYCYAKTRKSPFFISNNDVHLYNGGILGIFENKHLDYDIEKLVRILNSKKYWKVYESLSLTTGNKVSFQVPTLQNLPIPPTVNDYNYL